MSRASTAGTSPDYRADVDGLRAVAVLAVIANHVHEPLLPYGFLGVDVFFVISGYVITASLARGEFHSLGDLLQTFYARRVRRILPALVACVVLTSLTVSFVATHPEPSLDTGVSALAAVSNLRLLAASTNYFAASTTLNAFTHTWSLGVEEQFYVAFPLLLWAVKLRPAARAKGGVALAILAVLSIGSLALFTAWGGPSRPLAFYTMPARLWELGAGSLVFLSLERRPDPGRASSRVVDGASAIVLATLVAAQFGEGGSALLRTVLVVLCTCLLIAFLRPGMMAHRLLTTRPMLAIGVGSYSLYLCTGAC